MLKTKIILLILACLVPSLTFAQQLTKRLIYVGAMGGIATLSGDGSAVIKSSSAATSLLDPSDGPAGEIFAGIHLFQYVSFQADYVWNRNNVVLVSTSGTPGMLSFLRQPAVITQDAFLGSVLVYFRQRASRIRPYLSEGVGVVLIHSRSSGGAIVEGSPVRPPDTSNHASVALRTSVGIDIQLPGPWHVRYSFGQTINRNTLGRQVSPALHRVPENFQSLLGVYLQF